MMTDFVPQSRAFKELWEMVCGHHPACGCGACCAFSGWNEEDDERALLIERGEFFGNGAEDDQQ